VTVLKSLILNGVSLVSIYTFDYLLLPLATRGGIHRNIGWLYRVLWLIPLAATSLYLNVRIVNMHLQEAMRILCHNRAVGPAWLPSAVTLSNMESVRRFLRQLTAGQPCFSLVLYYGTECQLYRMLTALASSAYRVVMIITSIILTNTFSYVPVIGPFLGFAFLCWVNA
jgi:etoposide-induced 2.4 mRNA